DGPFGPLKTCGDGGSVSRRGGLEGGRTTEGAGAINPAGSDYAAIAADRFSLLGLRRRSVALSLTAIGAFSLAISYVVPVAATLAAGPGGTISPVRDVATPTLEFPALQIPRVTATPQAVPPVPTLRHRAPAKSGASSAPRHSRSAQTVPVVTNAYTTRPQPRPQTSNDANLPVYEDSIGTIPTMPSLPGADESQLTPPADAAPAPAAPPTTAGADDGWAPVSSTAMPATQTAQTRRWLSGRHA